MILFTDVLKKETIKKLVSLVDEEIKNFPCLTVPLHQSFNNMHQKYSNNKDFLELAHFSIEKTKEFLGKNCFVINAFFNIIDKNSNCLGHDHLHTHLNLVSAVYYLKNCDNNGTLFKFSNLNFLSMVENNSLLIFDGNIPHSINKYDGRKRYSIVFDFITD